MPAISLVDFKNSKNVRMVQSRGGARLLLETAQTFRVLRKSTWQNLERDFATEFGVLSEIDYAHATFAKELDDLVVTHPLIGYQFGLIVHRALLSNQPDARRKAVGFYSKCFPAREGFGSRKESNFVVAPREVLT